MQGQCVNPGVVQEWELEAYLYGDAGSHVSAHLEVCPACRARLTEMRLFEQRWHQMLHRFDCPSPDTLRDYAWRVLLRGQRNRIQAHLAQCPLCRAELDDLDEFVKVEKKDVLESALVRARHLAEETGLVVAQLLSPTALQRVPALRGETREVLLFDAQGLALSLNLEHEETGAYTLFGQLLSAGRSISPESYARLTSQVGQMVPIRVSLDAHGGFALPNIFAGVYQLAVDLVERRVIVPDLVLGQRESP